MTERLSALLRDEAGRLDVPPPPPAGPVLARGRSRRRRRRACVVVAGVTALAAVGVGVALSGGGDTTNAVDPAGTADDLGPVFSVGADVYLDGARTRATVDDTVVKTLYYSSAGLVVRHGENPYSDGGGPQRFSLVTPGGTVTPLSVATEETVHATDPSQPHLVYAGEAGGTVELVVHDVTIDETVARIPVPGLSGGWYPVALDGETAYVGDGSRLFEVDWREGTVAESDLEGFPEVAGGHVVAAGDGSVRVLDRQTGEPLVEVPVKGYGWLDLSPDGRFARLDAGRSGPDVYDVATGEHVTLDGPATTWGWTADGDLFRVEGSELTVCDSGTGACETVPVALVREPSDGNEGAVVECDENGCSTPEPEDHSGVLKLGGLAYES